MVILSHDVVLSEAEGGDKQGCFYISRPVGMFCGATLMVPVVRCCLSCFRLQKNCNTGESSQTGDTGSTVHTQVPTKRDLEFEISKPGTINTKHDNPNMTPAAHLRLRHKTFQHQQAGEGGFKYTRRQSEAGETELRFRQQL